MVCERNKRKKTKKGKKAKKKKISQAKQGIIEHNMQVAEPNASMYVPVEMTPNKLRHFFIANNTDIMEEKIVLFSGLENLFEDGTMLHTLNEDDVNGYYNTVEGFYVYINRNLKNNFVGTGINKHGVKIDYYIHSTIYDPTESLDLIHNMRTRTFDQKQYFGRINIVIIGFCQWRKIPADPLTIFNILTPKRTPEPYQFDMMTPLCLSLDMPMIWQASYH